MQCLRRTNLIMSQLYEDISTVRVFVYSLVIRQHRGKKGDRHVVCLVFWLCLQTRSDFHLSSLKPLSNTHCVEINDTFWHILHFLSHPSLKFQRKTQIAFPHRSPRSTKPSNFHHYHHLPPPAPLHLVQHRIESEGTESGGFCPLYLCLSFSHRARGANKKRRENNKPPSFHISSVHLKKDGEGRRGCRRSGRAQSVDKRKA